VAGPRFAIGMVVTLLKGGSLDGDRGYFSENFIQTK